MISTLTSSSSRTIFTSAIKLSLPKYGLQVNSKPIKYGLILTSEGLPQQNLISKTNKSFARFGTRSSSEKAIPIKRTTIESINTMHNYGLVIIGAASAVGIGTICYYGLGLSNKGPLERSVLWPRYIKDRIHSTYAHLGIGMGISATAAYATFRSPALMRFLSNGSLVVVFGSLAASSIASSIVQSIPYKPGFGLKQFAWATHCSLLGIILAPLSMFGGPQLIRAAFYTAGLVGSLSAIAVCSPSERFLISSVPAALALGTVFAGSIGSMFLPPTSRIGLSLYGISLYGGLLVFSGLLFYDTQKIIKKAESHPTYSLSPYDPINNSLHICTDIVDIFVRIMQLVNGDGGGQGKK